MGKIWNVTKAGALHTESSGAIADLAKSVELAAARVALHAKLTAAIEDAENVERAAEALRAAAAPSNEMTRQVNYLKPGAPELASQGPMVPPKSARTASPMSTLGGSFCGKSLEGSRPGQASRPESLTQVTPSTDELDESHAASRRLRPGPRVVPEEHNSRPESAIAMRILELHDRLGGLIK